MLNNVYNPSTNTGIDHLASMFPQVTNIINQSRNVVSNPQTTNIDEVQRLLSTLTAEQRSVVENDESYIIKKATVMEEFLIWCISSTTIGREYLLGHGEFKSKQLLDVTKELCNKAPTVTNNQINELKEAMALQQEQFITQMNAQAEQIKVLSAFKAQFGDDETIIENGEV